MFEEYAYSAHAFDWPIKNYRLPDNVGIVSEEIPAEEMPEQGIPPDV